MSLAEQGWAGTMQTTTMITTPERPVGSHEWWLRRLGARLDARQATMTRWVDYYDGRHPMHLISERMQATFAKRYPSWADNLIPLVINTENHRLHVQGVRYGSDAKDDPDAWRWWQENHLDADSALVHKDALLKGIAYVLVWPDASGTPQVTIEDAFQTIVETTPGRRWERRAALKRWIDDDRHLIAELYLPEAMYRYRSVDRADATGVPRWRPEGFGGADTVANKIGVIPIVPLVNRPSLSRIVGGRITSADDGESEIAAVYENQDAINAYRMMAMVASDAASYRQRYILNVDIPEDPRTGRPKKIFDAGADTFLTFPPPDPEDWPDASKAPKLELGEFQQTDTSGLLNLIRDEVRRMATKAQMPAHYFSQDQSVPPSGESIKSAEASFVMKIEDAQVHLGEGWEEVFRLNFLWRNDARGNVVDSEVFWRTAESRSEAVLTDAMVKAKTFGVQDELLQERWGLSPQEIERNKQLRDMAPAPPGPTTLVTTRKAGIY